MRYEYNVPFWFTTEDAIIPEEVLIPQVLIYGQLEDIVKLIKTYGFKKCYKLYKKYVYTQKDWDPKTVNFLELIIFAGMPNNNEQNNNKTRYIGSN
ncbi:MAG: hypothetical protein M1407_03915 [Deltaproteobacteria bacterium]|nr:hypothetical protein [Deltaproteobacteria bacterium]